MKKVITLAAISFAVIALTMGCGNNGDKNENKGSDTTVVASDTVRSTEPQEGDVCSVVNDSTGKTFGVVKVLRIEGDTYHIRTYGVSFESRPQEHDIKDLKATTSGIGHLPLNKNDFMSWNPEVIMSQPVNEEELEGYNLWKKQQ